MQVVQFAHTGAELRPRHARHHPITQNNSRHRIVENLQSRIRAFDGNSFVAGPLQNRFEKRPLRAAVIDKQNAQCLARILGCQIGKRRIEIHRQGLACPISSMQTMSAQHLRPRES